MASQEDFFRRLDAVNACSSSFEINSESRETPSTPERPVSVDSVTSLISPPPVLRPSTRERRHHCDEQGPFSFVPTRNTDGSLLQPSVRNHFPKKRKRVERLIVESMDKLESNEGYEAVDSQPETAVASLPPSTPIREAKTMRSRSLEIRNLGQETPRTPSPVDPHRMEVFQLMNRVNVSPFNPDQKGDFQKKRKALSPLDDPTPPITPAKSSFAGLGSESTLKRIRDELDEVIDTVKYGTDGSTCDEQSSGESVTQSDGNREMLLRPTKRAATSSRSWESSFSCMHKNDGSQPEDGPNSTTIATLQRMAEHYERTRDTWRVLAYRKAISALKKQNRPILTRTEAIKLPGVGKRIADKIEEIVSTGKLRRLEEAESDPNDAILKTFTQIYGVGLVQARSWISKGFKTLEDVQDRAELTKNQSVGLDHYVDFQQRIPRNEVKAHGALVDGEMLKISTKLRLTIGGSYRRGATTCGDIDFLITSVDDMPDHVLRSMVFEQLIPQLVKIDYLRVTLAAHSSDGGTKWSGAATLPDKSDGPWRRVDFLMVPPREWGAALIYFTGNDIFNRSLRLLARKKGMNLNQHGLFKDVLRGPGMEKITKGTLFESRDEEAMFEALGVPYRPPEDRIC